MAYQKDAIGYRLLFLIDDGNCIATFGSFLKVMHCVDRRINQHDCTTLKNGQLRKSNWKDLKEAWL